MPWTIPFNLLGIWVSGDLGGLTIYTDRFGRKTAFPKAPPEKPPTQNQIDQRERFRVAQAAWSSLTTVEKQNLEDVVLKVSLCMTGQNLYMSAKMMDSTGLWKTLQQQTGITLPEL